MLAYLGFGLRSCWGICVKPGIAISSEASSASWGETHDPSPLLLPPTPPGTVFSGLGFRFS